MLVKGNFHERSKWARYYFSSIGKKGEKIDWYLRKTTNDGELVYAKTDNHKKLRYVGRLIDIRENNWSNYMLFGLIEDADFFINDYLRKI